jgi:ribosomal protein S18 acetylase RimI-like enzyme
VDYSFLTAREADAPAVFRLYRSLIGTPGSTWSDEYPTEELVRRDVQMESLYVLKDAQGRLVAAAFAGPDDELKDLPWNMENPCELARVAVSLSLQNQGIGSYLLKQIIAAVKARGFDGIRMLVAINNHHALALYDKNGFQRLDTVQLYGHTFYRYKMIITHKAL